MYCWEQSQSIARTCSITVPVNQLLGARHRASERRTIEPLLKAVLSFLPIISMPYRELNISISDEGMTGGSVAIIVSMLVVASRVE